MDDTKNDPIELKGETFALVRRRQNGSAVYANSERTAYLRLGQEQEIKRELNVRKNLLANSFPIAECISEGDFDGKSYWIERSLGNYHFGDLFFKDIRGYGSIREETFNDFLNVLKRFRDAQERTIVLEPVRSDFLKDLIDFDGLSKDSALGLELLAPAWEKMLGVFEKMPSCLTHGDLLPNNLFHVGVIDFEGVQTGVVGYDMVSALTKSFWFPKEEGYEQRRKYWFSEAQITQLQDALSVYSTQEHEWDLSKFADELFLLRGLWWTSRNDKWPKIQRWRFERMSELLKIYLNGGPSVWRFWKERELTKNGRSLRANLSLG